MRETRAGRAEPPSLADRLRSLERQYADTSYAASLAERAWACLSNPMTLDREALRNARTLRETLRARQWKLGMQIRQLGMRLDP